MQPIVLLADSQLLFHRVGDVPWLARVRGGMESALSKAAYVGASNGDLPEFFELFRAAMEPLGVESCRAIPSRPSEADLEYLGDADLVLLAGGDVAKGWEVIAGEGMLPRILEGYYQGSVLMGVSAGAVQLGLGWVASNELGNGGAQVLETSKLVPRWIDVHAEPEWERLSTAMLLDLPDRKGSVDPAGAGWRVGLGIPSGGGAIFHPGSTLEAVRFPLQEIEVIEGELRHSLLVPPSDSAGVDSAGVDSPGVDSPGVDSPGR